MENPNIRVNSGHAFANNTFGDSNNFSKSKRISANNSPALKLLIIVSSAYNYTEQLLPGFNYNYKDFVNPNNWSEQSDPPEDRLKSYARKVGIDPNKVHYYI